MSIDELLKEYNNYQKDGLEERGISSTFTLKGLDEINKLVSDAVIQIQEFVNNGKKDSTINSVKNKALSILDPKSIWISKWLHEHNKNSVQSDIQDKTVEEIVKSLKLNIEKKRDEVSSLAYKIIDTRKQYRERINFYEAILERGTKILENTDPYENENFSAKMLVTMVKGSIINLENTIMNEIDPLLANTKLSVEKINMTLPTIASTLRAKLDIKTVQQQLSDLVSMVQVAVDLNSSVDDKVTKSVQETTLQTIRMIKHTGIDVNLLENKMKRDEEFKKKLTEAIKEVKSDINNQFNKVSSSYEILENNKTNQPLQLIYGEIPHE